jgi:SM-20-related protein
MTTVFDSLADSLAESGYAIADQFLSQDEVARILKTSEFLNTADTFKKAGVGKENHQVNEAIRGDYIQWLNQNTSSEPVQVYLKRLHEMILYLNQALFLSLKDYEAHMTIYPVGSFYKRHLDQFKKDDHRKLSVICYLNENWKKSDGGELRMYLSDNKTIDVLPVAGRLVCFRSDQVEHEVLPGSRERLSITGWILDQHADLRHL